MNDHWLVEHEDSRQLAEAAAEEVAAALKPAIESSGSGLLFAPGGSTPKASLALLARMPVDWSKVTLIPGDERLVPADSELSNYRALATAFDGTGASVTPLVSDHDNYRDAGEMADAMLRRLRWPPDLVWLGMGEDGHTASIFPGPDLEAALGAPAERRAIGVMPDPLPREASVARVTLTRSAILAARRIVVTISGTIKRMLIQRALVEGESSRLPIGRVLAGATQPVTIHWCP